jgi:hypothetical protein
MEAGDYMASSHVCMPYRLPPRETTGLCTDGAIQPRLNPLAVCCLAVNQAPPAVQADGGGVAEAKQFSPPLAAPVPPSTLPPPSTGRSGGPYLHTDP